jgi:DNA-binding CsgD family transcriptional regulator
VHSEAEEQTRERTGALGYAGEVFATIAGASRHEVRWFPTGVPARRDVAAGDEEFVETARDLQLRGIPLPALAVRSRNRGAMFLVLGQHAGPLAAIRLEHGERGFRPSRIAETRKFLEEHGAAVTHWIVDGAAPSWRRDNAPVSFVIDERLRPVLVEEPGTNETPLHSLYRPREGCAPPLLIETLRDLVHELSERPETSAATRSLPFAFVRLGRLAGAATPYFHVSVEPARRRATILRAMTRYQLSRREGQVLGEVLRGASSTEIGESLSISGSTATFHLKGLLRKTGSRNRTELTARVLGWDGES